MIFGPWNKIGGAKGYFRVPVEGGEPRPIGISPSQDDQVRFPRTVGALRVHPNGRQLVFVAMGEGSGAEIWALDNFLPKAAK